MAHRIRLLVGILCYAQVIWFSGCSKKAVQPQFSLHDSYVDDSAFAKKHFSTAGYITISPLKGDTGIDISSGIVVLPNPLLDVSKIKITSIALSKDNELIDGEFSENDTEATFIPKLNLQKFTTYNVSVKGLAHVTPEKEQASSIVPVEESWSFTTTASEPQYNMSRRTTQVTDFARDGSRMIQVGDYLYMYGGWTGDGSFNDIYRSRDDLSIWEKMTDAPWSGRHTFGVGKLGQNVFVFGGDYINPTFDVWRTRDGFNFTQVAGDLLTTVTNRLLYGTCIHNNKLFVLGGQFSFLYPGSGMNDVWSSSNGLVWTKIADSLDFLGKNISGSVASFNGKIWVVGGGYYGDYNVDTTIRWTNHVYSSPDGINWTKEEDAPWIGRQYLDVCVWDNKLWMVAGHHNGNLADIWYMTKDGNWTEFIPPNLFYPRHATAVAVYNDQLAIACGNVHNECWVISRN